MGSRAEPSVRHDQGVTHRRRSGTYFFFFAVVDFLVDGEVLAVAFVADFFGAVLAVALVAVDFVAVDFVAVALVAVDFFAVDFAGALAVDFVALAGALVAVFVVDFAAVLAGAFAAVRVVVFAAVFGAVLVAVVERRVVDVRVLLAFVVLGAFFAVVDRDAAGFEPARDVLLAVAVVAADVDRRVVLVADARLAGALASLR